MEQQRFVALVDHVEEFASTVATSEDQIPRRRLEEDIQVCKDLDAGLLPLGLIFAASASLERTAVRPFFARLAAELSDASAALDRVSETLLMITDADLRASGTIVASTLVLRAMPDGLSARDAILESLLRLIEPEHKARAARHSEIFALFSRAKERLALEQLPRLLTDVSDALEDVACETDVFLDNPIELTPKTAPSEVESSEDRLRQERVDSGADIPMLRDEIAKIEALQEEIGWTREKAILFITDLYERKVMDSRSKVGLSVASLVKTVTELKKALGVEVRDIRIEPQQPGETFSYDFDTAELLLYLGGRGSVTTRMIRESRERILERLKAEKIDRETSAIDKAIGRYREARDAVGAELVPIEEEKAEVEALAKCLNLPLVQAYDMVAELHRAERLELSRAEGEGVSLPVLREIVETVVEPGVISAITVDPQANAQFPFSIDKEGGTLKLHTSFEGLSDLTIRWCARERAIDPAPLVEPDEAALADYSDPREPGSVADERNVKRFIEEFRLNEELAGDSFEVMLEGCPGLQESVSIQALRVLVATLNQRIGPDARVDLVTAFSREIPGTSKVDYTSVAWMAEHTEEETTLNMLTLNFNYGEGKRKLPPFSDELLLDWCRHHILEK